MLNSLIFFSRPCLVIILWLGFVGTASAETQNEKVCKAHVLNKTKLVFVRVPKKTSETPWTGKVIKNLCAGTERPSEPLTCYRKANRSLTSRPSIGNLNQNALHLCGGTSDADKTTTCFRDALKNVSVKQAIEKCRIKSTHKPMQVKNGPTYNIPPSTQLKKPVTDQIADRRIDDLRRGQTQGIDPTQHGIRDEYLRPNKVIPENSIPRGRLPKVKPEYLVGRGIYDITGPASEIGMMGYAENSQKSAGLLDRQWARAFIVAEPNGKRVVFVNADQGQLFQSVNQGVLSKLRERFGGLYTDDNVVLSATHSHGTAGGHSNYFLYNVSVLGKLGHGKMNLQTYDAVVEGIFQAIVQAHNDLAPGWIYYNSGHLRRANKNRSIEAFRRNPEARSGGVSPEDTEMSLLTFFQNGEEVGLISWFPTHGVSMPSSNHMLTSDNKGYAQYVVETQKGTDYDGRGDYVAAFAQSNAGDMTPNLNLDGTGPGDKDHFASTKIIGQRQAGKALELVGSKGELLTGSIDYKHRYVDFARQTIDGRFTDGERRLTCSAALGTSFTAGTEDGRGLHVSEEGRRTERLPERQLIENRRCHNPKPVHVMFNIGEEGWPFQTPQTLPVSIIKIGQFGILAVPAEFTVVAGHRLKKTVRDVEGTGLTKLVVAGYSNAYAGYVTTKEEYDRQHYEGASTHFGPWTLSAYQQAFERLAVGLARGREPVFPEREPQPRVFPRAEDANPVHDIIDKLPLGPRACASTRCQYGSTLEEVNFSYRRQDRVSFKFQGASLRNDLNTMGSFFKVQRLDGSSWVDTASDNDWSTQLRWERPALTKRSRITIHWDIPSTSPRGTYRIKFDGKARKRGGAVTAFTAQSRNFIVR